jgi:hypothetical protein
MLSFLRCATFGKHSATRGGESVCRCVGMGGCGFSKPVKVAGGILRCALSQPHIPTYVFGVNKTSYRDFVLFSLVDIAAQMALGDQADSLLRREQHRVAKFHLEVRAQRQVHMRNPRQNLLGTFSFI